MAAMQFLRSAKPLARFVLLWFVLSLGAAIASPWVDPQPLQLVCSVSGVAKLVAASDDDTPAPLAHALDCPLCMGGVAPPVFGLSAAVLLPRSSGPVGHFSAFHVPRLAAAALPARGPPLPV